MVASCIGVIIEVCSCLDKLIRGTFVFGTVVLKLMETETVEIELLENIVDPVSTEPQYG